MSNYLNVHICSPGPDSIVVTRNGDMADIRFLNGDPSDEHRLGGERVSVTFAPDSRAGLLRLRAACDEALALLDEIERERADARAVAHRAEVL